MSALEGFHTTNGEVYGGRRENRFGRAESIALPLERFSAGREAHSLVWKPRETNGVNNYQQTSFGMREASDGTARVIGATVDLGLTPVHGLVRVGATMMSEMEKAKKMYVGGLVTLISEWQSPWGRVGAQFMTPVIAGAFVAAAVQGVVLGGIKGTYGLLKDKAHSFVNHLGGSGPTYFQSAAVAYVNE
ncbi:MAG: hypothetical protein Greene07147_620 [Parcubacteria group bacterium Greene0714_7]|nr:MAG: hypothetical protein Greene07147_620 [Parcubacteria group bacterium Greene0714_7]